jgi:O-antigen/teichoic acid export membrane protein
MRVATAVLPPPRGSLARLAHMTAAFAASDLLRGGIGFATSLVIARGLGRDAFGWWTLYMAWASTLTVLFDLGFGVLLTREAARGGRVGSLLAAGLTARLTLFIPFAILVVAAGPGRIGISSAAAQNVDLVIAIAAAGMTYGCLAAVYRASPEWLVGILTVEALGAAAQCLGSALIVGAGGAVTHLLWLATGVQVAQLVVALAAWRMVAPDDRLERPSARGLWTFVSRAFPFALTGIVANTQARMGPILLGWLGSPGDVASIGVALRLAGIARRLPSAAFGAALPVFSREIERGQPTPLRAHFDGALRWFALAAAAALVIGAGPIVQHTYGASFAAARYPLVWAGVGLVPALINAGRKVYLYAAGRELTVLRWSALAWLIQAAGCAAFIPRFGAAGAMCALVVGEAAIWLPLRRSSADPVTPGTSRR